METSVQVREIRIVPDLQPADYLTQILAYIAENPTRPNEAAWRWDQAARRRGMSPEVVESLRTAAIMIWKHGLFPTGA